MTCPTAAPAQTWGKALKRGTRRRRRRRRRGGSRGKGRGP
jgi:hypothetical protein